MADFAGLLNAGMAFIQATINLYDVYAHVTPSIGVHNLCESIMEEERQVLNRMAALSGDPSLGRRFGEVDGGFDTTRFNLLQSVDSGLSFHDFVALVAEREDVTLGFLAHLATLARTDDDRHELVRLTEGHRRQLSLARDRLDLEIMLSNG